VTALRSAPAIVLSHRLGAVLAPTAEACPLDAKVTKKKQDNIENRA
jgi:hypothetical protein